MEPISGVNPLNSEFVSVTEGEKEISISYWKDQKDITEWKKNAEHIAAQELGQSKWHKFYGVQVVEIIREYSGGGR